MSTCSVEKICNTKDEFGDMNGGVSFGFSFQLPELSMQAARGANTYRGMTPPTKSFFLWIKKQRP
jgi:hypothetical protein